MQISVEKISELERRLSVELPIELIKSSKQERLVELSKKVKFNGFRPGKVPLSVVATRFGKSIYQEVLMDLTTQSLKDASEQESFTIISQPDIKFTNQDEKNGPISFIATFEIKPTINLNDLTGVEIEEPTAEITETDLDVVLTTMQQQQVRWEEINRPAENGDRLIVDYKAQHVDGKTFPGSEKNNLAIVIGSNHFLTEFEQALIGAKAGNEVEKVINFPENYTIKELAGKLIEFKIIVHKVEASHKFDLNDEFASFMGIEEGGIEALKEQVLSNMKRQLEFKKKTLMKEKIFNALIEYNSISCLPQVFVKQHIDQLRHQSQEDISSDELNKAAERAVRISLLVESVIEKFEIKLEEERVYENLQQLFSAQNSSHALQNLFKDRSGFEQIKMLTLEDQVAERLSQNATLIPISMSYQEFMGLALQDNQTFSENHVHGPHCDHSHDEHNEHNYTD